MKQRTAEVLIVVAVLLVYLWTLGDGSGGRGQDYYEYQTDSGYADTELP